MAILFFIHEPRFCYACRLLRGGAESTEGGLLFNDVVAEVQSPVPATENARIICDNEGKVYE